MYNYIYKYKCNSRGDGILHMTIANCKYKLQISPGNIEYCKLRVTIS